MRTSEAGNEAADGPAWRAGASRPRATRLTAGFTLLELLVVIAIMAVATGGVTLALRDSSQTALEREAQRLSVLLESGRAQSRGSGVPVFWRTTAEGFRFDGLAPAALPSRWLTAGTGARLLSGASALQLGPDPIIGPQTVELFITTESTDAPKRVMQVATDGLRPFTVQAAEQP